jgi:hypothetical protein
MWSRWFPRVMTVLLVVTTGAGLISGGMAFQETLVNVFKWGGPTFPVDMRTQVSAINATVPREAPLFFIRNDPDPLVARIWQRALYPHPVFLITSAAAVHGPEYAALKSKYRVGHAVSMGMPPIDPGFAESHNIGTLGGDTVVFGGLAR